MTNNYCEKEQELIAALHGGMSSAELLCHAGSCPVCSEVLLISELLRKESVSLHSQLIPPDGTVIWRKAQTRAREKALANATLPIRIVRTCAYALAILVAPWIAVEFSGRLSWLPDLGLRHLTPTGLASVNSASTAISQIDRNWMVALTGTMLIGITATCLGIALSSWYMLREE